VSAHPDRGSAEFQTISERGLQARSSKGLANGSIIESGVFDPGPVQEPHAEQIESRLPELLPQLSPQLKMRRTPRILSRYASRGINTRNGNSIGNRDRSNSKRNRNETETKPKRDRNETESPTKGRA
jgi:hypothetical protein